MGLQFLRKLSEDSLAQKSLVDLLIKRLEGKEEARSHKVVHTSAITDDDLGFCPRQYALLDMLEQKLPPKWVTAAQRIAFDNGNALHDLCRNRWLREDVVGAWRCRSCNSDKTVKHFSKLPKVPCPACGVHDWGYEEEVIVDTETRVSASIDFFIDMNGSLLTPVEVKTVDKDEFNKLAGPIGRHRVRSQMYLAIMARSLPDSVREQVDLSQARLLYISKGYGKKHVEFDKVIPLKEFAVKRNDEAVAHYFKLAAEVHLFRTKGIMPKVICNGHQDRRAKHCAVCKACFSGKYPGGVKL